jgi:uncharacterized protein (DUF1697 family)
MPQFVVLLRGVNVGKGNRVPMAAFRALLEAEGFSEVATLLNSGNAVFRAAGHSAASHARVIRERLQQNLAISVPVIVKSASAVLAAVAESPFTVPEEHCSRFLVAFGQREDATKALAALLPVLEPPEQLRIGTHAAYLYCARGILESKLGSTVLGKSGSHVTTRNWATVLKLKAMLEQVSPNPSIERTAQSPLRGLWSAAHVER